MTAVTTIQADDVDTYEDLKDRVEAEGGVLPVKMETLRELQDAGRLGPHVVKGISDELARKGMGHFPHEELPTSQYEVVRVYQLGTAVADIVEAVLDPSEKNDEKLRKAANADTAEQLQKIREIVCD